MIITRILFHMVVIALVLNTVDRALAGQYVPLVHALLDWLRPGAFTVFALSTACIVNRRPGVLAALLGVAFLCTYQRIQDDVIAPAIPVLLGVLAARVVRALTNEARDEEEEA